MKHVYLVHYDNATHDPEFYIFSTLEGARQKITELMDDEPDEDGHLSWKPIENVAFDNLWQWTDDREYLSIWQEAVRP
jgi:hypothetical protein